MIRSFVLLLLALVAPTLVQGQGCPICGPPGAATYVGDNPPGNTVVQAAQDGQAAFTCDFLYDTFELQINNFRIGESSCTWAKWVATQMCDCQGSLWTWPEVVQNPICDVCGGPLADQYVGQPMGATGASAYYGMTCDGAVMGGFNRAFDSGICSGAKTAAKQYCGCGSSSITTSSPPPPAPAPAPAPAPQTASGNNSQCKAEGSICTTDYTSCCGECKASPTSSDPTRRICGAAPSAYDSGTGSRGYGGGGSGRGAGRGGSGGNRGGRNRKLNLRGEAEAENETQQSS